MAKKARSAKSLARAYHHGNLREVLIEATLRLVEEGGPEAVTVREAARRAGVSPGAPFRHFPNRTVLMTAVAEEATHRLHAAIFEAVADVSTEEPIERLRTIGRAYLSWAAENPTHFAVVSNRSLINYDSSASMKRLNEELQALMGQTLDEAQRQGLAPSVDPTTGLWPRAHERRRAPAAMGRGTRSGWRPGRTRDRSRARPLHRRPVRTAVIEVSPRSPARREPAGNPSRTRDRPPAAGRIAK
jgi:AcrR family transcriptional regulator